MLMHFHAYLPSFLCILILLCWYFLIVSFSFSLFFVLVCFMAPKRKSTPSQNPLRFGVSFSFNLTPSSIRFCDDEARKDFSENFCRRFIHSKHHVVLSDFSNIDLPTVIHSKGWESICDILLACPSVIIQEFYSNMHGINISVPHFFSRVRGMRIVVTLEIVSKVLHFPRVAHPDYLGYGHLRIVSKDELSSRFCETPFSWGNHQNTLYLGFAKGLRFLDMVMTFVLHPLSHYNSITEPRARFLLSFLKDTSIDFPSHFILSLIDVYRDMATRDKLIFPSVITWILHHFSVPFPVISYTLLLPFDRVRHSLD